jgi:hypothetical protein
MCDDLPGSLWSEHLPLWRDVFAIISLDGVCPFFPDMAITLRNPQSFQDDLRDTIRSYRDAYLLSGRPDAPDPRHPLTRAMVVDGLANVAQTLDESERAETKYWLLHIYSPAPSIPPHANRYRSVLWDWEREYSFKGNDLVAFANPDEIRTRFREAQRTDAIEKQIEQARSAPLSSWDRSAYELAGYSNDARRIANEEAKDPYDVVQSTILRERFRRFWLWLLGQATAEQMLTLRRLAIKKTERDEAQWGALPRLCDPFELFPSSHNTPSAPLH